MSRRLAWLEVVKAIGLWVVSVLLLVFIPLVAVLPYIIYQALDSRSCSAYSRSTDIRQMADLLFGGRHPSHTPDYARFCVVYDQRRRAAVFLESGGMGMAGTSQTRDIDKCSDRVGSLRRSRLE